MPPRQSIWQRDHALCRVEITEARRVGEERVAYLTDLLRQARPFVADPCDVHLTEDESARIRDLLAEIELAIGRAG